MDYSALAGWLAALVALVTLIIALRHRGEDMSVKKMNDALKPLAEDMARSMKYHAEHFENMKTLGTALTEARQQVNDHIRQDDERFGRIEDMHREIRADIKLLLGRE